MLLLPACRDAQSVQDAHAAVERQAADRLAGARCVGAHATDAQKADIARLLVVDSLAPRGSLPPWLPSGFVTPEGGGDGAEVWNALAGRCPGAPTFGTPFGFPSADIEKALRQDPAFAEAADRYWAQVEQYRHQPPNATR
ncbi:hypothetical protein [Xylophilus sp. GOD-11R]|uniref:hypothetical protein n=1 Tax=Xylophilus sp. GOD-11R TaxID=3089814 RepID=UPI00298D3B46|nr:hypothetical protein [Xylophilus sp. GOD-11R]WPB58316.1 hypothetical protein R9X41_06640 [Xylophilus sp. GOD-11R]